MKTSACKAFLISVLFFMATLAHAQISLSVGINLAPPMLPVYAQPAIPAEGYMWTPGYWSWNGDNNDYFWVPGTWVNAPYTGALWTPGYWGFAGGAYVWNRGYWGMHIGYYGGINYGFGYTGVGYQGGYWNNGAFNYNRNVNNVGNVHINNVYNSRVSVVQNTRVSFNGGTGGVQTTPSKNEQIINSMPHNQATALQEQHETASRAIPGQNLSVNHGIPKVAATPEPSSFTSDKVEAAKPMQVAHQAQPTAQQLRHIPACVPGIAFLSGGQSPADASMRLNAINLDKKLSTPWPLIFSFSRAVQQPVLETWRGEANNVERAQRRLIHRVRCNQAAIFGDYHPQMECVD